MLFKYVIYLIISLLINVIKNSEIIIPFTSSLSEIPKNLTPNDFIDSLSKNELYANIKIGTPPQNLDLIIKFEFYHLLIKDSPLDNISHKRFYPNQSSTFTNLSRSENFFFDTAGFTHAINSSDLFTINENITNSNFTFLQVTDPISQTKIEYPGVIGLNVVSNTEPFHFEQGLVYQLKSKNYTNNYIYTFVYNNNDDFKGKIKGKIIFGKNIYEEYSLDNYSSCYCFTAPDYTFYWGGNYINSFYNKESLKIKDILLKPELGVILFNNNIEEKLKKKFLDDKIKEGKCYKVYNFYTFYYCDIDVKIDIGIFEFSKPNSPLYFSLNSDDLTIQYNNKIFLLIGFRPTISEKEVHLGYPFFRKYDVIFDQNKRTFGFYNFKIGEKNKEDDHGDIPEKKDQNKGNDKTSGDNLIFKIIVIFLLTIIFLSLILLFSFYIFRNIKRKEK